MTGRRVVAVVIATAIAAGCSSGGRAERARSTTTASRSFGATTTAPRLRPSSGCAHPERVAPGVTMHTITSDGLVRRYELDVPTTYTATTPSGIVFGLHALTVDYRFVPSMTGFDLGAKYGFVGVSPSGLLHGPTPYWDAAPTAANYDVTFLSALLDHLEATLCIDTARVYSTGMSNGAQMSSLLACRLAGRIAAIAPVSGEEFLTPCAGRPVPIMAFHGTADPILPYAGGGLNATRIAQLYHYDGKLPAGLPSPRGVDQSMAEWAQHNGCAATYTERHVAPHVVRRVWDRCRAATVLYIIEGGGHAWPGKPQPAFEKQFGPGTREIDATNLMFDFFFRGRIG
jgi:polyhydroxybutyrate depolymerase